jgi:hypothetical protein
MGEILTSALDRSGIYGKMRRFSNPASGLRFRTFAARRTGPSSQSLLL